MSKSYNLRNTALAVGWVAATAELAMDTGTATAATNAQTVTSATQSVYAFTSPSNEPNVADWPAASVGDPYKVVIDVTVMEAAVALDGVAMFSRVTADASANAEVAVDGTWDTTTGTGLKTGTNTTWDPAAGANTDRFGIRIRCTTSNTMMSNAITIGSLNTTTTFAQGPWSTGTTFQQALAVTATLAPSMVRSLSFLRSLAIASTFAPSFGRVITKPLAVASTFTVAAVKRITKPLALTSTFSPSLAAQRIFLKSLDATSAFVGSMGTRLTVVRTLAATTTTSVAMVKRVGKPLAVASAFTPVVQKRVGKIIAVTSTFGVSALKRLSVTLAVASTFGAVLTESYTRLQTLAASGVFSASLTAVKQAGALAWRRLMMLLGVGR